MIEVLKDISNGLVFGICFVLGIRLMDCVICKVKRKSKVKEFHFLYMQEIKELNKKDRETFDPLFEHLNSEHDLILLESEKDDMIEIIFNLK